MDDKEKILACFSRLQTIMIPATIDNMETMLQTLYDLRDMYNKPEEEKNASNNE